MTQEAIKLKLRGYELGNISKETFLKLAEIWRTDSTIKATNLAALIIELEKELEPKLHVLVS